MAKAVKKTAKKAASKPVKKAAVKKAAPKAKAAKKVAPKKAAVKKAAPKAKAAPKKAVKKAAPKKSARKPNAAFMAPLNVTPVLAEVVGNKPMPRTEIVKKIWDYIKKNNLQDKKNKRMINADSKLKPVFGGKDQISMFDLAKLVNSQIAK
ncbi:SWIB/MDM2 domain-containing protein [Chitinophagaceae bacterium LB-8]|uniref:SWIB/MDM2 domain-containing protein n=1 Tax=Paraflavisolibacter caeni TaxID=2982496 RepID=A0A9X2Y0A4_9BACT|nr:SWIB/MDM2 domain-containing protein [Paraflavisolibacter caeni]MCU7552002.1 SWIB/MDM2 domain-containing protein [Paraflavisolibacter caeni]